MPTEHQENLLKYEQEKTEPEISLENARLCADLSRYWATGDNEVVFWKRKEIEILEAYYGEGQKKLGMVFSVDSGGNVINIWSAQMSLMKREEFNDDVIQDFMEKVWLIGDDLGDLVYFYGNGKDGHGIYRTSAGDMSFEYAQKIADSLTGFLSGGIGIDAAVTL